MAGSLFFVNPFGFFWRNSCAFPTPLTVYVCVAWPHSACFGAHHDVVPATYLPFYVANVPMQAPVHSALSLPHLARNTVLFTSVTRLPQAPPAFRCPLFLVGKLLGRLHGKAPQQQHLRLVFHMTCCARLRTTLHLPSTLQAHWSETSTPPVPSEVHVRPVHGNLDDNASVGCSCEISSPNALGNHTFPTTTCHMLDEARIF